MPADGRAGTSPRCQSCKSPLGYPDWGARSRAPGLHGGGFYLRARLIRPLTMGPAAGRPVGSDGAAGSPVGPTRFWVIACPGASCAGTGRPVRSDPAPIGAAGILLVGCGLWRATVGSEAGICIRGFGVLTILKLLGYAVVLGVVAALSIILRPLGVRGPH